MKRALPVLAAAYFLAFSSGGLQLPLTSTAMANVGLSMSAVGIMWAARSVLGIFGPALWGVLADRRGDARPFAAASLFSGAALLAVLALTTTPWVAIATFGMYGLLCGPSGSLLDGMTLTALAEDRHHFGRWRMWGSIGFGVSACVATVLLYFKLFDPSPSVVFPAAAVLTASGGAAVLFVKRLERPALARLRDVVPVIKRPDMVALFFTATILWCSHIGYSSFLLPLATARGLPEWTVGASLAAGIVVEALMLREAGYFITRFGSRNVLVATCALSVLRWTLIALTTSPVLFVALNALHGITFGLFFATLVAHVAAKSPPEMRQAAQGAIGSSSFGLGGGLGSLGCGWLIEHTDAVTTWWAMAAVAALALAVAWRTVR